MRQPLIYIQKLGNEKDSSPTERDLRVLVDKLNQASSVPRQPKESIGVHYTQHCHWAREGVVMLCFALSALTLSTGYRFGCYNIRRT